MAPKGEFPRQAPRRLGLVRGARQVHAGPARRSRSATDALPATTASSHYFRPAQPGATKRRARRARASALGHGALDGKRVLGRGRVHRRGRQALDDGHDRRGGERGRRRASAHFKINTAGGVASQSSSNAGGETVYRARAPPRFAMARAMSSTSRAASRCCARRELAWARSLHCLGSRFDGVTNPNRKTANPGELGCGRARRYIAAWYSSPKATRCGQPAVPSRLRRSKRRAVAVTNAYLDHAGPRTLTAVQFEQPSRRKSWARL